MLKAYLNMNDEVIEEYSDEEIVYEDVSVYDIPEISEEVQENVSPDTVVEEAVYVENGVDNQFSNEYSESIISESDQIPDEQVAAFVNDFPFQVAYDQVLFDGSEPFSRDQENGVDSVPSENVNTQIVPVLDQETIGSINSIESNISLIYSKIDSVENNLSLQSEAVSRIDNNVLQIGSNAALSSKVISGILIAIFGSILVFMVLSKIR